MRKKTIILASFALFGGYPSWGWLVREGRVELSDLRASAGWQPSAPEADGLSNWNSRADWRRSASPDAWNASGEGAV